MATIIIPAAPGFYLCYPDGTLAYDQRFATREMADKKRAILGFDDWLIKEVK